MPAGLVQLLAADPGRAHWLAAALWLSFYPVGRLSARASRAAYVAADDAVREASGRELSRPFAQGPADGDPLLSVGTLGAWLGIAALVFALCALIEGLARLLGWSAPVGLFLRACLGFFLFSNVMLFTQRARNVWFFRRIRRDAGLLAGLQRQDPVLLYWNGLLMQLQAAIVLAVAAVIAPNGWLWGGAAGLLWQAFRFWTSARGEQARRESAEP